MSQNFPLVIIGGNSLVGPYLMQALASEGYTAEVISRRDITVPEGFTTLHMDLTLARNWIAPVGAVVLSLLPLWVLAQFLPRFMGVKAIIATGSTSRYSKVSSSDLKERSTAAHLELAEEALERWAERSNVHWTLLRSTLVYDGQTDKNIARMASFIRRWHFLPLAAPAKGLRQPIHAADVARAVVKCINNPAVADRGFNIAGGEVLPYRQMAERVFTAMGEKPHFIMLPTDWLQKAFRGASKLGILNETAFGASIFQRMNEDLVFDTEDGLRVLDYQPRKFTPDLSPKI